MEIAQAFVRIRPQAGSFESDARREIEEPLRRIAGVVGGLALGKQIFDVARAGITELGEAQKAAALTEAAIRSTGGAANVTAEGVSNLAGRLSALSGIDDEVIQGGENMLLTFRKVRNEVGEGNAIFDRATEAALDMSIRGFGSVESASVMLGKALEDPIRGITALRRAGVTFTESQQATIQALVDSGNLLEAQRMILAELETQIGGSAEAFGETLPGEIGKAKNAIEEAKASLIQGLEPALRGGLGLVVDLAEGFGDLPAPMQTVTALTIGVGGGFVALARPINETIELLRTVRTEGSTWGSTLTKVGFGMAALSAVTIGATLVLDSYSKRKAEAARISDVLAQALADEANGMDEAVAKALAAELAAGKVGTALNRAEADFELLGSAVRTSGDDLDGLSRIVDDMRDKIGSGTIDVVEQLRFGLEEAGLAGTALGDELIRLGESLSPEEFDDLLKQLDTTATEYTKVATETKNVDDATRGLTGATDEAAASFDDEAASIDAAREAMVAMQEAIVGSINAQVGYEKAVDGAADALATYEEKARTAAEATGDDLAVAQEDAEDALLSAKDAMLGQAEAAVRLAEQNATAAGQTLSARDKTALYSAELARLRDGLAPGSPLRAAIDGFIGQLNAIPDRIRVQIEADMPARVGLATGGRTAIRAAAGFDGIVDRPTMFEVAEGGEAEHVKVTPLSQMRSGVTTAGGVHIEHAYFGQGAYADLDWFARTRLAGV